MKEKNYTVYEALKGRKHYLVFPGEWVSEDMVKAACSYFRCGEKNLYIGEGWIVKDELYLEDPEIKGAKVVSVISHWRKV